MIIRRDNDQCYNDGHRLIHSGGPALKRLIIALLLAASLPAPAPAQNLAPDPLGYVSPSRDFDARHVRVDLDLDVRGGRISGSVTHTIKAIKPGVDLIRLNCVGLDVSQVEIDGKPATFEYPVAGEFSTSWIDVADTRGATDELVVHTPRPLDLDEEIDVTVQYSGTPSQGLYFVRPEKGIADKRYEVWAQGEGEDNRYWIPCFDYPNDKATYEGIYRVDKGMTVISNGMLVEKKDVGDKTQFHWRLATPQVTYLITVAAAEYKVVEDKWNDILLMYVVPPGTDDPTVRRGYGLTADMMAFYSEYTGIYYPFEKYAQITVQNFIYGGMENTGATVMNMRMLYDERAEATRTEEGLVAHELAHMWWGDMVTCAEWSHIWLNEGFATYFQVLYRGHHEGDDALQYNMDDNHRRTFDADDRDARPMVVDFYNRRDKQNSANVYRRGASVLHMLRFLVGDELFRRVFRTYGETYKYQTAETADFMKVVRETTGDNLDWFFEQWAYLAGYPKLRISQTWDPETGMLRVSISQTQKVDKLTPIFRLPMDLEVTCKESTETYRIVVDKAEQDFYFKVPSNPLMVIVDKGHWTLAKQTFPKSSLELLYQIRHGDVMDRVDAARAMAMAGKGEDMNAIEALREVMLNEDAFWGLRAEAATALGKIGGEAAGQALVVALDLNDGRVRKAAVTATGDLDSSGPLDKVLQKVVKDDFAYEVRAEAVTALVKMKSPKARDVCVEALDIASHQEVIRQAGLNGLVKLESTTDLDRIKRMTGPGNARTYRHTAIKSYGQLAAKLDGKRDREKAATYLAGMLDDWWLRTRREVISAIGTVGEPNVVDDLRRVAANDPVGALRAQARTTAMKLESKDEAIAKKADQQAEIQALTEKMETLQAELDKLRASVSTNQPDRVSSNDNN